MASVIAFQTFMTLFLHLITIFFQLHFTTAKPVGFSLKLIPSDSPESPFYLRNLTKLEKMKMSIEFSKARANYSASISVHNKTINPNNIQLPINSLYFFYLTTILIGQPSTEVTLLVDTGAGLVWTQCEPCKYCFSQKPKIYHSRRSKTYAKLPCKDRICRKLYKCVNGQCVYKVKYPGAVATTRGIVSLETFQMPVKNQTHQLFPNMIIGCGNENRGFHFDQIRDNPVSGILGLSRQQVSLISQLRHEVNGRFSYCLHEGSSYLKFGEDIVLRGPNVQTTPLKHLDLTHYHLNLIDISVGSRRIKLPRGSFSLRNGGFIIDSGAPYTTIAHKAYAKVIRAFQDYYAGKLDRVDGKKYNLELCYAFKPNFRDFIRMTFHFQGADFVPRFVYSFDPQTRDTCIVLLPGKKTLLGAFHQRDTRFVYDINANVLQFVPENCSNDRG